MLRKLDPVLFALDRRWFFAAGSAVLSSNLIVNTFVLERFFAPDGHFVSRTKWLIAGYNLFSLVLAAALAFAALRLRGFRREVKLHHVLLALLGAEAFLRLTIFTDVLRIPPLENPRLYFLGSCGDDGYFVLRHYYDRDPPRGAPHERLGWVRGAGELGAITDRYYTMADVDARPLLFFGDSFVGWGEVMDEKLPQLLESRLSGFNVLNYGVPGYGADQIALRVREEVPKFLDKDPLVLVGILLDDLDRSLLKYRLSQKPYFEIEEGSLVLRQPRYATNEEFFEAYHFHGKSFALSPLMVAGGRLLGADNWCSARREGLNRAILADLVAYLRASGLEHHFVIFYSQNDLGSVSSLERELKSILESLSVVGVIDTKELLLEHLERTGAPRTSLYDDGGAGHHTVEARRVLADGIGRALSLPRPDRGEHSDGLGADDLEPRVGDGASELVGRQ